MQKNVNPTVCRKQIGLTVAFTPRKTVNIDGEYQAIPALPTPQELKAQLYCRMYDGIEDQWPAIQPVDGGLNGLN